MFSIHKIFGYLKSNKQYRFSSIKVGKNSIYFKLKRKGTSTEEVYITNNSNDENRSGITILTLEDYILVVAFNQKQTSFHLSVPVTQLENLNLEINLALRYLTRSHNKVNDSRL